MGKFWVFSVFIIVSVAHFFALQSYITQQDAISKPKAKIHRITLSSVVVKKPRVKVEPIILPPDPKPLIETKPIIEKSKNKVKKKRKRVKKKKVHKAKAKPLQEKIVKPVVEPIVEQRAPIKSVDTSSIRDYYTSKIRRQIQKHLYYPKIAKRMRIQGIVRVVFRVLKNGDITDIRVINVPRKLLRKGAIKTLKSLSLPAIPAELGEAFLDINIPIEFKLIKG